MHAEYNLVRLSKTQSNERRGRGERRHTEAAEGHDERREDDPVLLAPDDPAAVEEDEAGEEVAEGEEDVGADEDVRLVREPVHARC